MKPPTCVLCGRDANTGDLVSFRDAETLPKGMTGQPRGMCWFCPRHIAAAEAKSHLDTAEALRFLRGKYRWGLRIGAVLGRFRRH